MLFLIIITHAHHGQQHKKSRFTTVYHNSGTTIHIDVIP